MSSYWDTKHSLSLGVEVSIRGRYCGGPGYKGCPIHVVYSDGNNSKFGSYPRKAGVVALSPRPLCFVDAGSAILEGPFTLDQAPELRICGQGQFPRYLELNVLRQPWTLALSEDSMEAMPSLRERWAHHCQTIQPVAFLDYMSLDGNDGFELPPNSHYHVPGFLATTIGMDHSALVYGALQHLQGVQPTPPAPPPKSKPKPDIFKIGREPRRIEGGP